MISPIQKLILEAWENINQAEFQTLQANSDHIDPDPEFDPRESLSKAIGLLTIAAAKLDQAKAQLPQ